MDFSFTFLLTFTNSSPMLGRMFNDDPLAQKSLFAARIIGG
jgi:hypothetical protein